MNHMSPIYTFSSESVTNMSGVYFVPAHLVMLVLKSGDYLCNSTEVMDSPPSIGAGLQAQGQGQSSQ